MKTLRQQYPFLLTTLLVTVLLLVPLFAHAVNIVEGVFLDLLYKLVINITGLLLGIAGVVLNYAVNNFVIGFGVQFETSGIGVAVDSTWVIIRDFMNLFFIFGLVYIGFKMILDSSNSNTRRWLVNLIIAALLINFSLFFTKVVVDVSNQLAAQIAVAAFEDTAAAGETYQVDMSGTFMNAMNITSLFSTKTAGGQNSGTDARPPEAGIGYIIFTGILLLVTAFVFAAGGLLLLIRFALLNLFLVLSPIMFIGWILPPVSDLMSRYWKAFLGRAFFAPIYLLFIYFSLTILRGFQSQINLVGGVGASNLSAASIPSEAQERAIEGSVPFFILVIIFMIASLVIANKMGADGAGQAVGLGKAIGNKVKRGVTNTAINTAKLAGRGAGMATAGAVGAVGRNTIGRWSDNYANSDKGKSRANTLTGRMALKAAAGLADSNFDVRSVGGVGKAMGIGEGRKGGYQSAYKEKLKEKEALVESLKVSEDEAREDGAQIEVANHKDAKDKYESEKTKEEGIVANERAPHDANIARLKLAYDGETDKDKKEQIGKEMDQQRGFIKDIKDKSEANVKLFEKAMKEAEKQMNEAITRVQYQHVDSYLNSQEAWSKGNGNKLRIGAIGSSVIGAAAVGLGPLGGGLVAAGLAGEYKKDERIKKDIRKKVEKERAKGRKGERNAASTNAAPATPTTAPTTP